MATLSIDTEIGRLLRQLGLSSQDLSAVLGISSRTVARWMDGTAYPQHKSRENLNALFGLADRLDDTFASHESAMKWLQTESAYFGGLRPSDALLRGRIDAVDAALEALDSGIFV